MDYKATIGLEIHAELKTKTKMFCNSKNDPDERTPNVHVCPVCMAHPGTLPVINKQAVKHVLKIGHAVGGQCADFTEFDRKNYFYPDIPKGYQISQYKYPLVSGGSIAGIELTRIHLEEDTARSTHERGDYSLVDFNRAGVPLMELVTEPVVRDAETAVQFARELRLLLRYLGASDANMEKGEMRVEANVSISKTDELGTKVEVKNLNSFRSVERAIAYEIARQQEVLESGEKVVQETRGWDENKNKTFSQRAKESAHDYRYFPDPDLPKLIISNLPEYNAETLKKELPELPWVRRERLIKEFGVQDTIADLFVNNKTLGDFFEEVVGESADKKTIELAANYISSDLLGLSGGSGETGSVTAEAMRELVAMIREDEISSRGAKEVLAVLYADGGTAQAVAKEKNLLQQSDEGALAGVIESIIKEHDAVVAEYKAGKDAALQFLIGQGMKATKGAANPGVLRKLFIEQLGEPSGK